MDPCRPKLVLCGLEGLTGMHRTVVHPDVERTVSLPVRSMDQRASGQSPEEAREPLAITGAHLFGCDADGQVNNLAADIPGTAPGQSRAHGVFQTARLCDHGQLQFREKVQRQSSACDSITRSFSWKGRSFVMSRTKAHGPSAYS